MMDENVALDSTKQKKFVKSIKGIKKLIKKKDAVSKAGDDADKIKKGRVSKKKRKERGLVYISHIPHGFYEHEMTQYFKQFGVVTNARVIRSKRTGQSKGYAFVEFKEPAVADIVAETMNNYLMGKRLLKAAIIPPEKQRRAFRKNWNPQNCPGNTQRIQTKKGYNKNRDEKGELQRAKKRLANVNRTIKRLSELGISYDFFNPVDVPEALLKKESEDDKDNTTGDVNTKKKVKKEEIKPVPKVNGKSIKKENVKEEIIAKNKKVKAKKQEKEVVVNKKEQKQKKKILQNKGVKSMEEFIKVQEETDASGSDFEFDSDEYEKVLDADDDSIGSEEEESNDDESDDDELSDESEEVGPVKPQSKKKVAPKANDESIGSEEEESNDDESDDDELSDESEEIETVKPQSKKKVTPNANDDSIDSEDEELNDDDLSDDDSDESEEKEPVKPQIKKVTPKPNRSVTQLKKAAGKPQNKVAPQQGKRKAPQKIVPAAALTKKPKFEKQTNQKLRNKQFKKKK